jgi:hypothetical protein
MQAFAPMPATHTFSHKDVDLRLHRLVAACVEKIDRNPALLEEARIQAGRYSNVRLRKEWELLLGLPWAKLRLVLLEESEDGDRIRQSVPFGGFLGDEERMRILKSS